MIFNILSHRGGPGILFQNRVVKDHPITFESSGPTQGHPPQRAQVIEHRHRHRPQTHRP